MLDATTIILVLWGPTVLLFLSAVAQVQFEAVLLTLASYARARGTSTVWKSLQPGILQIVNELEGAFKGKSTSTQLLLTSILIAVLWGAERIASSTRRRA
jgi:hypothetical protein